MADIFDLEQSIMKCWSVVDDIDMLYENVMERNTPLSADELSNILLGMKSLYNLKFEKCFSDFEEICRQYHQLRKFKESKDFTEIKERFE